MQSWTVNVKYKGISRGRRPELAGGGLIRSLGGWSQVLSLRLSFTIPDLPSLVKEVCEGEGVDEAELRSALRKRQAVKSRRVFCQIAVKKTGG